MATIIVVEALVDGKAALVLSRSHVNPYAAWAAAANAITERLGSPHWTVGRATTRRLAAPVAHAERPTGHSKTWRIRIGIYPGPSGRVLLLCIGSREWAWKFSRKPEGA